MDLEKIKRKKKKKSINFFLFGCDENSGEEGKVEKYCILVSLPLCLPTSSTQSILEIVQFQLFLKQHWIL